MKLFNTITEAVKDYSQLKVEGCKDAVQIYKNNKGNITPITRRCINIALFDTDKYAEYAKDIKGERLKRIKKVATVATAATYSAILAIIVS